MIIDLVIIFVCLAACTIICCSVAHKQYAKRYEFTTRIIYTYKKENDNIIEDKLQSALQDMGKHGWRVIYIEQHTNWHYYVVFERLKIDSINYD